MTIRSMNYYTLAGTSITEHKLLPLLFAPPLSPGAQIIALPLFVVYQLHFSCEPNEFDTIHDFIVMKETKQPYALFYLSSSVASWPRSSFKISTWHNYMEKLEDKQKLFLFFGKSVLTCFSSSTHFWSASVLPAWFWSSCSCSIDTKRKKDKARSTSVYISISAISAFHLYTYPLLQKLLDGVLDQLALSTTK